MKRVCFLCTAFPTIVTRNALTGTAFRDILTGNALTGITFPKHFNAKCADRQGASKYCVVKGVDTEMRRQAEQNAFTQGNAVPVITSRVNMFGKAVPVSAYRCQQHLRPAALARA